MPPNPSSPRVKLRTTATRRVPRVRSAGKTTDEAVDYEPEPNMKLSRALAVVLLLHVVAIGGIIAFSLIKDHNPDHLTAGTAGAAASTAAEPEDARIPAVMNREPADGGTRPAIHVVRQGETLTRIANANGVSLEALIAANTSTAVGGIHPGQQLKLPEKVSAPAARPSGAGDNADSAATKNSAQDDADLAAVNLTPRTNTPVKATPRPTPAPESGQTYTVGKGDSPYTIAHKFKISPEALLKLNSIDDPKKIKPGQKLRIPVKAAPSKADTKSKLKA